MASRLAADAVMLVHFAYLAFVAVGALLAWRWPRLVWAHLPAVAWALATVSIGVACPLTALEKRLRRWAGTSGYEGGFVDHYLEDVVYPDEYTVVLRTLVAVAIVGGYLGLRRRADGAASERALS